MGREPNTTIEQSQKRKHNGCIMAEKKNLPMKFQVKTSSTLRDMMILLRSIFS